MKRIAKENCVYKLDPSAKPVLTIESGEEVVFELEDGFSGDIRSDDDSALKVDFARVLPATGPVFVENALPGDALAIDIEQIRLGRQGVVLVIDRVGVLRDKIKGPYTKVTPILDGKIKFSKDIELPTRPMIGFVAVAPKAETVSIVPGDHGGNMDHTDLTTKNRLYLPVFVEGGHLYMGDLHAAMGDGEICAMGIECAGEVTAKITLLKNARLLRPMLETPRSVMTIGAAVRLDDAIKIAVEDMVNLVREVRRLSNEEAYALTSVAADLRISQIVNGLLTVRMEMPKTVLPRAIA